MSATKGATPAPNNFYLGKIFSLRKQLQIFDILMHFNPTHEERLWLAGFLKFAGYSLDEVITIIDNHCLWTDYDPAITAYQVATVFMQPRKGNSNDNGNGKQRRPRKWDLTPLEVAKIKAARSAEINRKLTAWLRENELPVYDVEHL